MSFFSKFSKETVESNNQKVETQPQQPKQESNRPPATDIARDVIGHGCGVLGTVAGIVGLVGGAMAVFTMLVSALGWSVMATIMALLGVSILLTVIGNYTAVHQLEEVRSVYVG